MANAVRQRLIEANYLKVSGEFLVMGTGFTDLDESPGAKTTSKRYINDKSETKTINGYDWSASYTTDLIPTKKVINFICDIGRLQKLGADTETEYLIVDMDRQGATANTYHARKINVAIEVKDFKTKDGEMSATGSLLGKGDVIEGTFDITTRLFTPSWTEPIIPVLTLTSVAGLLSGATKVTVTETLGTGNSYVYKTATSLSTPLIGEDCEFGYTAWDGIVDITATTGNKILVVEINVDKLAVKAGLATVTAKV